jgi:hypothetical protein
MKTWIIEEIENAIVQKLAEELKADKIRVVSFADGIENYNKPQGEKLIIVGFAAAKSEPPATKIMHGVTIQDENLEFDLIFRLKNLRTHQPAYDIANKIRQVLTKFAPLQKRREWLYQTDFRFRDLDENRIWNYTQTFAIQLPYQQYRS